MNRDQTIDIVIPLYNEDKILEASVERLIGSLSTSGFPYPYIVTLANNASTDQSLMICDRLAVRFQNVKVLDLDKKGKGFAIREAWKRSSADIVAFMDADLSSDLRYFRALVDAIAIGGRDLSIGNRLGPKSRVYSRKFMRKVLSRLYNSFARFFFGTRVADHQCGFKAMRRSSFGKLSNELREDGYLIDTELIALSAKHGFSLQEVDIIWTDSKDSKLSLVGDSVKVLRDFIDLRRRLKR